MKCSDHVILFLVHLVLMSSGFAGHALADEINFTEWATTSCMSKAPEGHAQLECVGKSAQSCMRDTPHGETTIGMMGCYDAERTYWDNRLNMAYRVLMKQHQSSDAEMKKLGSATQPIAEALRTMQRTWIAWRDASCTYERTRWLGGTGGRPATAACSMMLTAKQALALEAWRRNE